jgi:hypothetical protein
MINNIYIRCGGGRANPDVAIDRVYGQGAARSILSNLCLMCVRAYVQYAITGHDHQQKICCPGNVSI